MTRGSGADADDGEPQVRALTVPRGGADDEDEPYDDDVDDDPDDDDDDEARAAKAAQRWTRRAFEAAQRGRPRAAAAAFEKALELTPDDAPYRAALLINAGSYLAFSGRSADALGPLKEAARLAPDDARALHALGNALHQCDAAGDALEVYARALHAAPSPDFPPNAPLLNNVATILLARGERSLARGALEKSLEIEPHAPGTLFNLATARYSDALETRSQKRRRSDEASRIVVEASFSPGKADDDNDDGGALDDVLRLLDAAEPHAPPGSPLRERVLALRACAANRVPGRAALAAADLRDVLEHGAEHARDARRRGAALLELSRALQDDAAARRDALAEAVAVLTRRRRGADGRDEYSPLEAWGGAPRALRARARLGSACRRRATTPPGVRPPRGGRGPGRRRRPARGAGGRAGRASPRETRPPTIPASLAANGRARARLPTCLRAVRGAAERAAFGERAILRRTPMRSRETSRNGIPPRPRRGSKAPPITFAQAQACAATSRPRAPPARSRGWAVPAHQWRPCPVGWGETPRRRIHRRAPAGAAFPFPSVLPLVLSRAFVAHRHD